MVFKYYTFVLDDDFLHTRFGELQLRDRFRDGGAVEEMPNEDEMNIVSETSHLPNLPDDFAEANMQMQSGLSYCHFHVKKPSTVTSRDPDSADIFNEESVFNEVGSFPVKHRAENNGKKGSCYRCFKGNRFTEKAVCIVCDAKYCQKCVLRAMGSMPEGRKWITCICFRIDEMRRSDLGKCSRVLKWLLPESEIKQIMSSEVSCPANQIPPNLVYVNGEALDDKELLLLRGCPNPPKKLRPGYYWYDKVAGFWGKEEQKPCQMISAQLNIGGYIKRDASNGNTDVLINCWEITKDEVWMLKLEFHAKENLIVILCLLLFIELLAMLGVSIYLVCAILYLPIPPDNAKSGEEATRDSLGQNDLHRKLLLVGFDKSGTSTIFKQAVEISKEEYEPSDMDILYAKGITSSNGLASVEFSFPTPAKLDGYIDSTDQHYSMMRYQLIRVHRRNLGENCKLLEMFEDVNIVLFCISLADYDEFYDDKNGSLINKMMASKQLFESVVTHPTFYKKDFLLIMNKFDLLEEKIEQSPLTQCEWFCDFHPVPGPNYHIGPKVFPLSSLAQRAFHYMALKFKRLLHSLTECKLYVSLVTGLEQDNVDESLKYAREIMNWDEEAITFINEEYSTSLEGSTS
ncbi:hypothetical protein NL676_015577 [Syzygium grande]|nr:hypothetical protein NL676_015577 [Syzygium grande]